MHQIKSMAFILRRVLGVRGGSSPNPQPPPPKKILSCSDAFKVYSVFAFFTQEGTSPPPKKKKKNLHFYGIFFPITQKSSAVINDEFFAQVSRIPNFTHPDVVCAHIVLFVSSRANLRGEKVQKGHTSIKATLLSPK